MCHCALLYIYNFYLEIQRESTYTRAFKKVRKFMQMPKEAYPHEFIPLLFAACSLDLNMSNSDTFYGETSLLCCTSKLNLCETRRFFGVLVYR